MKTLARQLEAVLFVEGDAIAKTKLQRMLNVSAEELAAAIEQLKKDLHGRSITLVETDTAVALRTHPDAAAFLQQLYQKEQETDLGQAAMEVLAIVLYKGAASKAEIDYIRGVNSSFSLRTLLIRGLLERFKEGSQYRYRATPAALAHLGITTPAELPDKEHIQQAMEAYLTSQA